MEREPGGIDGSKSVRDMHHLRLMSLLQEQVRDHGRKRAAEILGVDRRTLDTALDQGVLTRRIRGALERALQSGVGSAAAQQRDRNDKLEDRLGDLEGLVEEQGREMRAGRRAAEDEIRKLREEQAQGLRRIERAVAGLNAAGGDKEEAAKSSGPQPAKQANLRREYPELVTLDPAGDDEDVFGDAWELVQEWRKLKETHPNEGKRPGLAADGRKVPVSGIGAAGGPRPDPASGPVSLAGLRPGRADRLAKKSPGRYPAEGQKAQAPGVGEALPEPGAVAQVEGLTVAAFVNSLSETAKGVLQGVFCCPGACDNGGVVWLYQGFRP